MFKIGVDIGGTFTDLILIDDSGHISEYKVPTTPHDFSQGFMAVLSEAAAVYHIPVADFTARIELVIHGTTIATNALVTRNLARTAMITTRGFRDIIEIRRALKIETRSMYEAFIPPYQPLIPRYLRFTVHEETRYTGEVTVPVDPRELQSVIGKIKAEAVEAVAICFINSYANPDNEKQTAEICRRELPDVFITCSSDILPVMGEYERESTCVINACVGPVVSRYLTDLEKMLEASGFQGQLLMMQANQYTQSVSTIKTKPVYLIGSGPAAAPSGGAYLGKFIKEPDLVTADMGGTTLDAALIKNGEGVLTAGKWFGDEKIGIKVADVSSIGAGGGSIAWFDSLGLLRVGPQSAGADPGPACYNKGGKEPTVTDAALVLGYLPSDYFCGGKVPLDIAIARQALKKVAGRLETSIEEAARAVFDTVNAAMADEISRITTRKGYDIRDFSLVACGGGGPMCGAFWAEILECKNVIVPNYTSSFCAWSMFTLDVGRDYLRSFIRRLSDADAAEINLLFREMLQESLSDFEGFKVSESDLLITRSADLRYQGQYHEVEIEFSSQQITPEDLVLMADSFHRKHEDLYTFTLSWGPVEIRNLRLIVRAQSRKIDPVRIARGTRDSSPAFKRTRKCYFKGNPYDTSVYDSLKLKAGNLITGPAIIEVPTTTVVIPPDFQCKVDVFNNYIIRRK